MGFVYGLWSGARELRRGTNTVDLRNFGTLRRHPVERRGPEVLEKSWIPAQKPCRNDEVGAIAMTTWLNTTTLSYHGERDKRP